MITCAAPWLITYAAPWLITCAAPWMITCAALYTDAGLGGPKTPSETMVTNKNVFKLMMISK